MTADFIFTIIVSHKGIMIVCQLERIPLFRIWILYVLLWRVHDFLLLYHISSQFGLLSPLFEEIRVFIGQRVLHLSKMVSPMNKHLVACVG